MVGKMTKERNKDLIEGMAWRTNIKWQRNVTHGDMMMLVGQCDGITHFVLVACVNFPN
jgi:hypothetical protein